jgi:hypothetical protein
VIDPERDLREMAQRLSEADTVENRAASRPPSSFVALRIVVAGEGLANTHISAGAQEGQRGGLAAIIRQVMTDVGAHLGRAALADAPLRTRASFNFKL